MDHSKSTYGSFKKYVEIIQKVRMDHAKIAFSAENRNISNNMLCYFDNRYYKQNDFHYFGRITSLIWKNNFLKAKPKVSIIFD